MTTSLDQLFKKYKISQSKQHTLKRCCKPRQIDFVSLVQNFGPWLDRPFKMDDYNKDYQLVHYGNEIYGMYPSEGYDPYTDDFTLNVSKTDHVHELGTPQFLIKFNKQDYKEAKEKWKNYWDWKKNRNQKRGELEEKFGYDTKHAMHLVRLLRMGYEALTEGQLYVKRPDADELLSIREGSWEYNELVEYAEYMDNLVRNDLMNKTDLPKKPDTKKAAQLLMQVQDEVWK